MEDLAYRLLKVKPLDFIPQHTRNLGNEFKCYMQEYNDEVS